MSPFHKFFPINEKPRKWTAIIVTVALAGLLTVWGIYGIGQYGIALFILTPLLIGAFPTLLFGYRRSVSRGNR